MKESNVVYVSNEVKLSSLVEETIANASGFRFSGNLYYSHDLIALIQKAKADIDEK